jgi:hypothetical protein
MFKIYGTQSTSYFVYEIHLEQREST